MPRFTHISLFAITFALLLAARVVAAPSGPPAPDSGPTPPAAVTEFQLLAGGSLL